jgi:hypothetical protein
VTSWGQALFICGGSLGFSGLWVMSHRSNSVLLTSAMWIHQPLLGAFSWLSESHMATPTAAETREKVPGSVSGLVTGWAAFLCTLLDFGNPGTNT